MNYDALLAARTENMKASAIRETLKVASQPGIVSLAGGVPDPAGFPLEIIRELSSRVVDKYPEAAFQYGPTEGFPPLREVLSDRLRESGTNVDRDELLIFSGSQGVLDALGKVLISRGDKVVVETPTYLGALQAFNAYGPSYVCIDSDENGPVAASLARALEQNDVKFVYLVPTFQNPTGRTISLERRKEIAELIRFHNVLLVEDDPYSRLRYEGAHLPTLKSMAPDHVVYVGSLSKVFAPGFRLGFAAAPGILARWLVIVKQGVDLHTSSFSQALAAEYLAGGHLDTHVPRLIERYKPKRDAMLKALDLHFPSDFKWSRPEGGMFVWVEGTKGIDMDEVYKRSIVRSVAFLPGRYFFARDGEGRETMRLNFSKADSDSIEQAIRILSEEVDRGSRRSVLAG